MLPGYWLEGVYLEFWGIVGGQRQMVLVHSWAIRSSKKSSNSGFGSESGYTGAFISPEFPVRLGALPNEDLLWLPKRRNGGLRNRRPRRT